MDIDDLKRLERQRYGEALRQQMALNQAKRKGHQPSNIQSQRRIDPVAMQPIIDLREQQKLALQRRLQQQNFYNQEHRKLPEQKQLPPPAAYNQYLAYNPYPYSKLQLQTSPNAPEHVVQVPQEYLAPLSQVELPSQVRLGDSGLGGQQGLESLKGFKGEDLRRKGVLKLENINEMEVQEKKSVQAKYIRDLELQMQQERHRKEEEKRRRKLEDQLQEERAKREMLELAQRDQQINEKQRQKVRQKEEQQRQLQENIQKFQQESLKLKQEKRRRPTEQQPASQSFAPEKRVKTEDDYVQSGLVPSPHDGHHQQSGLVQSEVFMLRESQRKEELERQRFQKELLEKEMQRQQKEFESKLELQREIDKMRFEVQSQADRFRDEIEKLRLQSQLTKESKERTQLELNYLKDQFRRQTEAEEEIRKRYEEEIQNIKHNQSRLVQALKKTNQPTPPPPFIDSPSGDKSLTAWTRNVPVVPSQDRLLRDVLSPLYEDLPEPQPRPRQVRAIKVDESIRTIDSEISREIDRLVRVDRRVPEPQSSSALKRAGRSMLEERGGTLRSAGTQGGLNTRVSLDTVNINERNDRRLQRYDSQKEDEDFGRLDNLLQQFA